MSEEISAGVRDKLEKKVKAIGMHGKLITDEQEKDLISYAVENGLEPEDAEHVIEAIAAEKGYVVEGHLNETLAVILKNMGKIDKEEFSQVLAMAKEFSRGALPEVKLKKNIKQIMIEHGIAADSGGLFSSDWFKAI